MSLRLAFMGTPDFAVPTLHALLAAGHDVVAVYTQPPAPAGRGKTLRKSAVHRFAEEKGLFVTTPKNLKDPSEHAAFAALNLDAAVVVAYGQILPAAILNAPTHGCFNVHASLLPRWRGAAPIHRAIMTGDTTSGVCIMQMDTGLDTGPIVLQQKTAIAPNETTASLHDKLAQIGAEAIAPALAGVVDGTLIPIEQPHEGVTYAKKIDKAEAHINWQLSAIEIDRMVRGLCPFPGAWFTVDGERIKLLAGTPTNDTGPAGTVLNDSLLIACGTGGYQIERAQRAGKAVMDRADLLNGWSVPKGCEVNS